MKSSQELVTWSQWTEPGGTVGQSRTLLSSWPLALDPQGHLGAEVCWAPTLQLEREPGCRTEEKGPACRRDFNPDLWDSDHDRNSKDGGQGLAPDPTGPVMTVLSEASHLL